MVRRLAALVASTSVLALAAVPLAAQTGWNWSTTLRAGYASFA